jgi:hypothetical protein
MSEQAEFVRIWRAWRRTAAPTQNFRLGHSHAPTYVIELELDHLVSSVNATVDAFMEGKSWDLGVRAADDLEALHTIEADLQRCLASGPERHSLEIFVMSTRRVLHAFLRWLTAREQA